jgi:hypothetical protein
MQASAMVAEFRAKKRAKTQEAGAAAAAAAAPDRPAEADPDGQSDPERDEWWFVLATRILHDRTPLK